MTEEVQRALMMKLVAQPSGEDAKVRAALEAIHDPLIRGLEMRITTASLTLSAGTLAELLAD
jgi:hypothetical protein